MIFSTVLTVPSGATDHVALLWYSNVFAQNDFSYYKTKQFFSCALYFTNLQPWQSSENNGSRLFNIE